MSDQKVPWPGFWAFCKCCWYADGLIGDRSGWDAINAFCATATPEELKRLEELVESVGFLTWFGISHTVVTMIFKFFGHDDQK